MGYRGYIGIEYEGRNFTEDEGIMLTKRLFGPAYLDLTGFRLTGFKNLSV
jgi:hypothetical protein